MTLHLPLDDPRWELFAQSCARGLSPMRAAQVAEYPRPGPKGRKLLERPEIAARVAAIVKHRGGGGSGDVDALIDRLIVLAEEAAETKVPRGLDVARACLAEAGRLKASMPFEPMPAPPPKRAMSLAEWRMKHDPTLPGSEAARRAAGEDV